jgi:hypothetical protein
MEKKEIKDEVEEVSGSNFTFQTTKGNWFFFH